LEEFAVGVATEEEDESGEVGFEPVEVVGGVADIAQQGCVELLVVGGEPAAEELEEFGEFDGVVGGETDVGYGGAFRVGSWVRTLGRRAWSGVG
jgi:hypothetical protein